MSDERSYNTTFLRRFVRFGTLGTALAAALLAAGCGSSGGSDSGGQNPTPGLIGVAGGSLTSADGKVTLAVPPNAVNSDTQFTIAPANGFPPSSRIVGTVYEIGPTGTVFPAGALPQLTMALPAGANAATATIGTMENGQWADVAGSAVSQVAQTVTASLAHLSPYAVLQPEGGPNQDPTASAGGPYDGVVGVPVSFTAAGSSDPNNDPLTFTWDFGDNSLPVSVTAPITTHTYSSLGTFTATLTVSDGQGGSDTAQATVTITDESQNTPPIADAGGPYAGTVGQLIQFNASGSSDPDGDPLTYLWNFGNGDSRLGMNPMYAYTSDGTWPVTLTVSDGRGGSDDDNATAVVNPLPPTNTPPVINGNPTIPTAGLVNQPLQFDADASDVDGDALTFTWNFGDGSTSTPSQTSATTHIYAGAGSFPVTVTVNDGHGGQVSSAPVTVTITVPTGGPVAFPQTYQIYFPQGADPIYFVRYAITLSGSGTPPLKFKIASPPSHQDPSLPNMAMVVGEYYQWWNPALPGWRPECHVRVGVDRTCRATASYTVDPVTKFVSTCVWSPITLSCPPGQPVEVPSTDPSLKPIVVFHAQRCVTWTPVPRTDSFTFTVTDGNGITSEPATITIVNPNPEPTCDGKEH
jgi:PKD repeat protein